MLKKILLGISLTAFLSIAIGIPMANASLGGAFSGGGLTSIIADTIYMRLDGAQPASNTITLTPKTCPTLELAFSGTSNNGICDNATNTRPTWFSNGVQIFEASGVVGFTVSTASTF